MSCNTNKPEKNHPMRTIVSTIETAPYRTTKYLVDIIEPNLSKSGVINLSSFVNEVAKRETTQEENQVSLMSLICIILYP